MPMFRLKLFYHIVSQFKQRERVNMHNIFFDSSPRPAPRSTRRGRIILWDVFPA
jgi:hypothetical protein